LERAAVADKKDELAKRHIVWNLDGDALHELLARIGAYIRLHFQRLTAPDFGAVEGDAVERA
jgi:hypothetical protein